MIPRVDWATRSFSLYLGHTHTHTRTHTRGLPWWLSVKKPSCNAGATGDANSISGLLGRSPGEGLGNPLQYSCLKSPMDRGAWWVTVLKVAETQRQLKGFSTRAHTHTHTLTQSGGTSQKFTFKKEAGIIHHDTNTFIDGALVY